MDELVVDRSSLDEETAFLTTADSAIRLVSAATKPVKGWKGLEYRAAFPEPKPRGSNFYPPDMDKTVHAKQMMSELNDTICEYETYIIMFICCLGV